MLKSKERISNALNGVADYIKVEGNEYYLISKDESYKRLIHKQTFDAVRDILKPAGNGLYELV